MKLKLALVGNDSVDGHDFDSAGGVFGRSKKCDWVLPDTDRILSSLHGRISHSDGQFYLKDESTNGIYLDGDQKPIGRGNSVLIEPGMKFFAGRYLILASLEGAAEHPKAPSVSVPQERHEASLTDLLTPRRQPNPKQADMRPAPVDLDADRANDPLAYFDDDSGPNPSLGGSKGFPGAPMGQPDWGAGPSYSDHQNAHRAPSLSAAPDVVVPEQRSTGPSVAPNVTARPPAPAAPMPISERMEPNAAEADDIARLANLLGNGQEEMSPPPKGHIEPPLGAPAAFAPPPPAVDPIPPAAPQPAPQASAGPAIPDDFDFLSVLGSSKRASQTPPPAVPQSPVGSPSGLPPSMSADLMHIPEPGTDGGAAKPAEVSDPMDAMMARRAERAAALKAKSANTAHAPVLPEANQVVPGVGVASANAPWDGMPPMASTGTSQQAPTEGAQSAAPTQASAKPGAADPLDEQALSLFFSALGFPDVDLSSTQRNDVMLDAGRMIRETAKGLILLLSARKMVKSEFRMDETQIRPEDNNPFKHFRISELALDEMFLTRKGGYLSPPQAVNEAFEDLQQHTMLTMSAMQKAIKLLFDQLSPEAITYQIEQQGGRIRGLGVGKSEWAMYVEQHERLSGRIDGLARQIISEAFAQAEEEFARKMASERREKNQ
ncbi:type VI secretion system-associated FHA domain protein TagH [uncultured Cohaesibacter sp.]|uniref:type VI secretion system-associated FHA domain protein TagH n=1 Tax=uncultured Cohaesibacter sp. TaxID=1002546 RepID=UPI0029C8E3CD|nr:type VI secretion system-associated FHA domain protein TagH [uncultured Cohaesibacter sp.]